jgi:hypothetical protein
MQQKKNRYLTKNSLGTSLCKRHKQAPDENWKPVGEAVAEIRNHYNELAVTLNQKKGTDRQLITLDYMTRGPRF